MDETNRLDAPNLLENNNIYPWLAYPWLAYDFATLYDEISLPCIHILFCIYYLNVHFRLIISEDYREMLKP